MLLIGISLGLLYFDYHNYIDILGAIFFGLLLLFAYIWLLAHKPVLLSIAVLIFSTLLIIGINLLYKTSTYVWMSYYALIGIISSEHSFKNKTPAVNNITKSLATIFCVITFLVMNKIFAIFTLSPWAAQLKWLFISYAMPFSLYFFNVIELKRPKIAK